MDEIKLLVGVVISIPETNGTSWYMVGILLAMLMVPLVPWSSRDICRYCGFTKFHRLF